MPYIDDVWFSDDYGAAMLNNQPGLTYTGWYRPYNNYNANARAGAWNARAGSGFTNSTADTHKNFAGIGGSTNAGAGAGNTGAGGLKGAFAGWKDKASNFGAKAANYIDPNAYSWGKKSGLTFTNPSTGKVTSLGKWGNIASGIMQGVDAAKGISDYQNIKTDNQDLMSDIQVAAMGNPLLSSYLTSDQLDLLGDIQGGRYDASNAGADTFLSGAVGGIGQAVPAALIGGLTGGIPGAIIGGVGSLVNSGIDSLSSEAGQNTAELQALYQALQDAEMQYKSMKRPNFTGLGIQQQYQNMYA